jgi:orotidine-5'-phosphate decarboxylase
MAAAYYPVGCGNDPMSRHLTRCREIVGDKLWFLIPGVGAQGGCVEETVRAAYCGPGSIAINSSSEIDFASAGEDFAQAAAGKAEELRDQINAAL